MTFYTDPLVTLLLGDCLEVLPTLPVDSVDAVVTDPPYGLEFMGKEWDAFRSDDPGTNRHRGERAGEHGAKVGGIFASDGRPKAKVAYGGGERAKTNRCVGCGKRDQFRNPHSCPEGTLWKSELIDPYAAPPSSLAFQNWCRTWALAALRVTKPGGYLLSFGGTRTHHRLVCGLEDAGWIIRDELDWIYASGFPKGKANLKPAHEPIVLARKPGPLRPLAIDECRIGTTETLGREKGGWGNAAVGATNYGNFNSIGVTVEGGRWPSNVLLSDPELFDEPNPYVVGSGATLSANVGSTRGEYASKDGNIYGGGRGFATDDWKGIGDSIGYTDSGGYSRFFIIPKADRAERERGLADRPKEIVKTQGKAEGWTWDENGGHSTGDNRQPRANVHPTVKPIDLMRHLVRLVTPPGGTCLDPFLGSGTTCLAASEEGFRSIGIERELEYLEIAKGRLMATPMGLGLDAGSMPEEVA